MYGMGNANVIAMEAAQADGEKPQAPVLVTGAAGYIGSIVVRRLLDQGYRVRALDRLLYGDAALRGVLRHPNFELVIADFRDRAVASRAVAGTSAVIHLGAIVGDPACAVNDDFTVGTNFEATRILAAACKEHGVRRFIFGSTCSVYGASDEILDETSALQSGLALRQHEDRRRTRAASACTTRPSRR